MNRIGTHISNMMEPAELKLSRKEHIRNYIMLYLLMAQSSIPFFVGDEFLIGGMVLSLIAFLVTRQTVDKFILTYSYIFLAIFCLQALFFSVDEINIILAYMFRIIYAYMTIKVIGRNITKYYLNIMYFFALLSFVFFIPSLLIPNITLSFFETVSSLIEPFQLHDPGRSHILIYTFGLDYTDVEGLMSAIPRNSGPFWEPGGFGIFLNIAILFELITTKKLFTKKTIVFYIALLSTLSTGSFISLFLLIVFYLLAYPTVYRMLAVGLFSVIGIIVYFNTFFLNEKINRHLDMDKRVSLEYAPRTRFVSAQLDMQDFFANPILGRGRFTKTRFDIVESSDNIILNHRTNSTTNMLVEFGIFGFIAFFYTMFLSFRQLCNYHSFKENFAYFIIIVVMAFGFYEMIFIKPFFIGLSFMFLATGYGKIRQTGKKYNEQLIGKHL